ncbi:hypothetical protein HYC85_029662 [Camellia sinensis]|uniref:RRM domain-containing protein n=1 Tax=Camellia sinensis TaxID=4442 RepID=A0A7J7FZW7_CAMSI|nr:hypothetical protein HYC85_029662 [Camellia sinensis]
MASSRNPLIRCSRTRFASGFKSQPFHSLLSNSALKEIVKFATTYTVVQSVGIGFADFLQKHSIVIGIQGLLPPMQHSLDLDPRSRSRSRSWSRPRSRSRSRSRSRGRGRVTEREVEDHFSKEGKVASCFLVVKPCTRASRGFAFITMDIVDDANRCIKRLMLLVADGCCLWMCASWERDSCFPRWPTKSFHVCLYCMRSTEDQVDSFLEKAMIEIKKQYAVFDAKRHTLDLLSRISMQKKR